MSIWISGQHIGTDPTVMYEAGDGVYEVDLGDGKQARGRQPVEQKAERGNVLSYANGWSNHYPDLTGEAERPAVLATAWVPHWCVPGVEEGDYDYEALGQWLRLEVAAPTTLNFWRKNDDGSPLMEDEGASIVLDKEAVRSLRDDLTLWLDRATVEPTPRGRRDG